MSGKFRRLSKQECRRLVQKGLMKRQRPAARLTTGEDESNYCGNLITSGKLSPRRRIETPPETRRVKSRTRSLLNGNVKKGESEKEFGVRQGTSKG